MLGRAVSVVSGNVSGHVGDHASALSFMDEGERKAYVESSEEEQAAWLAKGRSRRGTHISSLLVAMCAALCWVRLDAAVFGCCCVRMCEGCWGAL